MLGEFPLLSQPQWDGDHVAYSELDTPVAFVVMHRARKVAPAVAPQDILNRIGGERAAWSAWPGHTPRRWPFRLSSPSRCQSLQKAAAIQLRSQPLGDIDLKLAELCETGAPNLVIGNRSDLNHWSCFISATLVQPGYRRRNRHAWHRAALSLCHVPNAAPYPAACRCARHGR